jgi:hypothetical protein
LKQTNTENEEHLGSYFWLPITKPTNGHASPSGRPWGFMAIIQVFDKRTRSLCANRVEYDTWRHIMLPLDREFELDVEGDSDDIIVLCRIS